MKSLFILFTLFSMNAFAEVSLEDCLADALQQSARKNPVFPLPECVEIVRHDPGAVKITSSDNRWNAFGVGHMIYVESLNAQGEVVERNLLSGEFSEMGSVKKIYIDLPQKKLVVVQERNDGHELNIQDLEFIGNTSPLKLMRHSSFAGISALKYLNADAIEFTNSSGTFTVNADGESRVGISWKKPLTFQPK